MVTRKPGPGGVGEERQEAGGWLSHGGWRKSSLLRLEDELTGSVMSQYLSLARDKYWDLAIHPNKISVCCFQC